MTELKTQENDTDPRVYLQSITPEQRRQDAFELLELFNRVTGWQPRMWGSSIIGYGAYDYTYASGRSGRWMATGFSPRKSYLSVYIMPGYADFGPILARLGPHKKGKSCLNITRLEKVDLDVLGELIVAGLQDLAKTWPVIPGVKLDKSPPL